MKTIFTIAFIALSFNVFAQIPKTGLVAYYPFSGNANDSSTNANDGTVYGSTLTIDRFGNTNSAYSFNGTNNYIEVVHSSTLQFALHQQSISCWVKITQIPISIDEQAIFEKMEQHLGTDPTGNSAQGFKVVFASSGDIYYSIKSGSSSNWCSVTIPINLLSMNQYYNIAFTNNNDSLKSYLNGVKINSTKIPSGTTIGTNSSPFLIGKELWTSNGANMDYFKGILDDIAIYDRALTDSEIDSVYNSPNPIITGIKEFSLNNIGYPNPTMDILYLNLTEPTNVKVISHSGQVVKVVQNCIGQIDLSSLNNGLYIVQITNNNSFGTKNYKIEKK
jgi:hypothetical protein